MTSNHLYTSGFFCSLTPKTRLTVYAVKPSHHAVQYCVNIADEVVVNVVQSLVPLSFSLTFAPFPNIQILVLLYLFSAILSHWRVFTALSFFFLFRWRGQRFSSAVWEEKN